MAKSWLFRNRPNPFKGPRDGAEEEGGAEEGKRRGGKGGEGKEKAAHDTPPHPTEPPAGTVRVIPPERGKGNLQRSPRGRKRAEEETERPHVGPW